MWMAVLVLVLVVMRMMRRRTAARLKWREASGPSTSARCTLPPLPLPLSHRHPQVRQCSRAWGRRAQLLPLLYPPSPRMPRQPPLLLPRLPQPLPLPLHQPQMPLPQAPLPAPPLSSARRSWTWASRAPTVTSRSARLETTSSVLLISCLRTAGMRLRRSLHGRSRYGRGSCGSMQREWPLGTHGRLLGLEGQMGEADSLPPLPLSLAPLALSPPPSCQWGPCLCPPCLVVGWVVVCPLQASSCAPPLAQARAPQARVASPPTWPLWPLCTAWTRCLQSCFGLSRLPPPPPLAPPPMLHHQQQAVVVVVVQAGAQESGRVVALARAQGLPHHAASYPLAWLAHAVLLVRVQTASRRYRIASWSACARQRSWQRSCRPHTVRARPHAALLQCPWTPRVTCMP